MVTTGITSAGGGVPAVGAGAKRTVGAGSIDGGAGDSVVDATIVTITADAPTTVGNSGIDDDRVIASRIIKPGLTFGSNLLSQNEDATVFKRSVGRFTFKIKFDTRMFGFGMILFIHKRSGNIPEEFVGAGMIELD